MGKPSYNIEGCKNLSFEDFRSLHEKIEYFLYLTDEEWQNEYLLATGGETVQEYEVKKPKSKRG